MNEKRWLAAYVKMHHEKRVRDWLTATGIENFLPVQTEIRQWSDRKKKVERVLISMMIFVKVDRTEQQTVIEHPSVLRWLVLRSEHTPTEIPEYQMDSFRFMLGQNDFSVTFDTTNLQAGEKVRVIRGPLKGLLGELITVNGKSNVAIRIDQLGCAVVEMDSTNVELVK